MRNINNNSLKAFYENARLKDAVYDYLVEYLRDMIIDRAFKKEDIKDLAEARIVIEKAFANLEGMYEKNKNIQSDSK